MNDEEKKQDENELQGLIDKVKDLEAENKRLKADNKTLINNMVEKPKEESYNKGEESKPKTWEERVKELQEAKAKRSK